MIKKFTPTATLPPKDWAMKAPPHEYFNLIEKMHNRLDNLKHTHPDIVRRNIARAMITEFIMDLNAEFGRVG